MKNTGFGTGFKYKLVSLKNIQIFDKFAEEYDSWFDKHNFVYKSELLALKKFIPKKGKGLEIGIGTGRFSVPLGIKTGVEPAKRMANIARSRGIEVYEAKAEKLPFKKSCFDFVLMTTTICFLKNPINAIKEIKRVLKSDGHLIIGMIDKNSFLGKNYESKKKYSKFYKYTNFYSVNHVLSWLRKLDYNNFKICQTIFKGIDKITAIEPVKDGYGKGGFVIISASKNNS